MIDTVIWDWNGTLLDDAELAFEILNIMLKRHGVKEVNCLSDYKKIFGFPIIDYYRRAGFNFDKTSYEELAAEFTVLYAQRVTGCPLHDDAVETLDKIKAIGIRQIILSATKQSVLQEQISMFKLSHYFDELVGTGDIYAASKVSAGLFWKEKTGPMNALMCGDTLHDFDTANALSAKIVLCSRGHDSHEALVSTGAPVISSLKEIFDYIQLF